MIQSPLKEKKKNSLNFRIKNSTNIGIIPNSFFSQLNDLYYLHSWSVFFNPNSPPLPPCYFHCWLVFLSPNGTLVFFIVWFFSAPILPPCFVHCWSVSSASSPPPHHSPKILGDRRFFLWEVEELYFSIRENVWKEMISEHSTRTTSTQHSNNQHLRPMPS